MSFNDAVTRAKERSESPDAAGRDELGNDRRELAVNMHMPDPRLTAGPYSQDDRRALTQRVVGGGAGVEALAGAGVVVLAVLSLLDVAAQQLAAIAAIAAGGGFLLRGSLTASRVHEMLVHDRPEEASLVSGLSVEVLAGVGGIVLGILAFLDVAPEILLCSAAIAFGAALLLGAAMTRAIDEAIGGLSNVAKAALDAELGFVGLVGAGVVALGILGLLAIAEPMTFISIALIAVGGDMMLHAIPGLARLSGFGR